MDGEKTRPLIDEEHGVNMTGEDGLDILENTFLTETCKTAEDRYIFIFVMLYQPGTIQK